MSRFQRVPEELPALFQELIARHMPELANAHIVYMFDTKKVINQGKIQFAKIQKSSDLIRFLTQDMVDDAEGSDYILTIDKLLWGMMAPEDATRVLRHELRHATYDSEANNPYGLRGHTVEDFHEEIALNTDDPRWAQRLALLLENEYTIQAAGATTTQQQQDLFPEPGGDGQSRGGGGDELLVSESSHSDSEMAID